MHACYHQQKGMTRSSAPYCTIQLPSGRPSSLAVSTSVHAATCAKRSITQMVVLSCIRMELTGISSCHFLMYL